MSTSIKPTVGRVVLVFFAPAASGVMEGYSFPTTADTPVPGLIAHVHDDGRINVAAFDAHGANLPLTNVRLRQDFEDRPASGCWAEWMPYQKQQAEKHANEVARADEPKVGSHPAVSPIGWRCEEGGQPGVWSRIDAPKLASSNTSEAAIEREIVAKGLTAPRLSPADLDANIAHTEIVRYVSQSGQVLRWAILTTQNGFAVVGKPSVAVSPENDNAEIGEKVAIDNSRTELWPLMGYALKQELHMRERFGTHDEA